MSIATSVSPVSINPSQAWDGNDGPWSSFFIGIGTPPQYVRVLISTTGPQPWTVNPMGCTPEDPSDCAKVRGGFFLANESSTWEKAGFYQIDIERNLGYTGNGEFGFDSVVLGTPGSGAYTVNHQVVASIAAKDFYIATWGIAPRATNFSTMDAENSHESMLSTLRRNGQIPSLSFAYTAGARYRLKQVLGSLTFGGYDASRFVLNNVSFGFANDNSRDLVVGIQSITSIGLTGKSINLLPEAVLAFVDSTISHIWLPLKSCQAFEATFGLQWDPLSELYLVNDSLHDALMTRNASLTFRLGTDTTSNQTADIVLPYASFDLEVLNTYSNVNKTIRYFPLRRAANDTQYTLGRTFLQEAYLIVDHERANFSISQCRFTENMSPSIQSILSINSTNTTNVQPEPAPPLSLSAEVSIAVVAATLICVTLIAIVIRRNRRRKKLLERDSALKRLAKFPSAPEADRGFDSNQVGNIEIDGQQQPTPELDSVLQNEADAGVAAHEIIDEATAVHEMP